MIARLVGGPLDGTKLKLRARKTFLWVDVRAPHKCYVSAGKHRVLYIYEKKGRYLLGQNTHAQCSGCGLYSETIDGHVTTCSLCGSALMTHS